MFNYYLCVFASGRVYSGAEKLISKAKEKLSTTSLLVSEIAYALGFEHPQSFSTLFKKKTNLSPVEFRQAFNLCWTGKNSDST